MYPRAAWQLRVRAASACGGEAEARKASWVRARAEQLPAGLGTFSVANLGQSFRWMDRGLVAVTVRQGADGPTYDRVTAGPHLSGSRRRRQKRMHSPVDEVILAVVDAVKQRARTQAVSVRALESVRDLVVNDEAEIAIDYLVNTVNFHRLTLRQDEYERLLEAAARLGCADGVTDVDPRLLVPSRSSADGLDH